jgi:O-antigen/teichoic acid export membrane protein
MRQSLRQLRPDLLVALGLLALPLILFAPVTFGGRTILPADNLLAVEPWRSAAGEFGYSDAIVPHNKLLDDLVLENYPWKRFILQSLRAGELPLWNPYQFAGLPFLAAGQSSSLYPFSGIFLLFPLAQAYGLFTVSQIFMAGLFTYLLLRILGFGRLGAAFGAVVYELSLFMVVSVVFPMIIAGAVWLPLVLAAIELTVRQQAAIGGRPASWPWVTLGAGAVGMQILAGHVEVVYYTLLIAAAYSAWRLAGVYLVARRANSSMRPALIRMGARAAALLALAGSGLALGAIQFVPLIELVRHNFRSGSATYEQIIGWAFPWRHAVTFLVPNFYGNPSHHVYFDLFNWQWTRASVNALGQSIDTIDWGIKNYVEGGAYVGLLPLLLVPLALAAWLRGRRSIAANDIKQRTAIGFFGVLAFFALAFAFGTPLYRLIFALPGIDQLHSPFRWVWPLSLCIAVLSAAGLDYLQARRRSSIRCAHRTPFLGRLLLLGSEASLESALAGMAVWGGTLVTVGVLAARLGYDTLGISGVMNRLLAELARANEAFADGRMFFSYEAPWLLRFAMLFIASGIVLRLSRSRLSWRGRPVWMPLALAVLAIDLLSAGWGFNPAADPRLLEYVPPSVEFLRQDKSLFRYTTFDPHGQKPFNANLGWYFDLYDIRGYDSIFTQQYKRYMELIQPQHELDFNRIAPLTETEALNSPLLDLLNVKYVISLEAIDNPKFALVYDSEVKIYENLAVVQRAFTLPLANTVTTADFGAAVQSYDPRRYVILEHEGGEAPPANLAGDWPEPVETINYSADEVFVTASVDTPAWLVLADSYFPGWKAYMRPAGTGENEERPLTIALVNGNFRGVQLAPGDWTVRFKYSPDSVKVGGIVSLISGVSLLFGLLVFGWRYFYRESAMDSTARRVAKNSLAPMVLTLFNRGISLAFAAFMLRVLGPADAGKYYYAVVVFGWFEIITNYGLNALLMRDVARDRAHANRYLVNTTILRLALGVVVIPGLAIMLWLRQTLPSVALPFGLGAFHPDRLTNDTLLAIALLVLAQAPATVSTGLSALFYAYEQAEYPAAVATLTTLATVSLGTIALVLGYGFVGLAATSIVVNVITLVVLSALAWRLFFRPRLEFDLAFQRHALRESFPLMLNSLLATLFFKVDVTLLEPIRGNSEVGWYSTGYKFVDAFNVIPSLFTFALFPVMARQAREDRAALRRSYTLAIKLLISVALPLAVVTAFSAQSLVGLLGGAEYLPYGGIALSILIWSIPFGWVNSVTNYLLISLDQQRGLTRAFAISLLFNIVLNLLLLPRFGFAAAAAITIASELFEGVLFYIYLRRSLGPVPWLAVFWRLWAAAGLMALVTFMLWPVLPVAALAAGLAVYGICIGILRPFDAGERAILAGILPDRFRPFIWRG